MQLKRGDIFQIPISKLSNGFGQIIQVRKNSITIVVFEHKYSNQEGRISTIIKDNILFFGNTFDSLIILKYWQIIGNIESNLISVKLPYYKLGTWPEAFVEDFFEKFIHKASLMEYEKLQYRSFIAPIRFQNALKAYYKIGDWNSDFDKLLYGNVIKEIKIVESY